ncbi:MAG: CBS domain-containing protein, partial [Candidatus Nanoarchaeia archaeon]
MTCSPVILSPETNVVECAKVMAEKHVGSIAVGEDGN